MLEQKLVVEEVDRTEWDRVWASMKHRKIADPTTLNVSAGMDFGPVISASVSEAPLQYLDSLYLPNEACALCSASTVDTDRFPVSFSLEFDRVKSLGVFAWAHRQCFDALEESDKPPPIPW